MAVSENSLQISKLYNHTTFRMLYLYQEQESTAQFSKGGFQPHCTQSGCYKAMESATLQNLEWNHLHFKEGLCIFLPCTFWGLSTHKTQEKPSHLLHNKLPSSLFTSLLSSLPSSLPSSLFTSWAVLLLFCAYYLIRKLWFYIFWKPIMRNCRRMAETSKFIYFQREARCSEHAEEWLKTMQ